MDIVSLFEDGRTTLNYVEIAFEQLILKDRYKFLVNFNSMRQKFFRIDFSLSNVTSWKCDVYLQAGEFVYVMTTSFENNKQSLFDLYEKLERASTKTMYKSKMKRKVADGSRSSTENGGKRLRIKDVRKPSEPELPSS